MPRINVIFTFDKGEQRFADVELPEFWHTKEAAVEFLKSMAFVGKLWSDDLGTVQFNPHWGR